MTTARRTLRSRLLCPRLRAYAFAVLVAAAGLAVTAAMARPLGTPFFMFQFAAVMGAALYGGLGPGLLSAAISAAAFYAAFYAPGLQSWQAYRLASFGVCAVVFVALAARLRAARLAAEHAGEESRTSALLRERFVAIVSHDLRNPLHAITVTAERLRRLGDVTERQATGLARIQDCAARMQSLIRDLLDLARFQEKGGIPVQRRPARVGEVCRAALDEVEAAHPGRPIALEVSGDDAALVDPARVAQLVCNLVVNALQHGATDAPVRVAVAASPEAVRIEVANEGPPIPPELLTQLFEPFRGGDAPGSVGLGLFIVREIARAHGGSVSARSDAGAGTAFAVVLPRGDLGSATSVAPAAA